MASPPSAHDIDFQKALQDFKKEANLTPKEVDEFKFDSLEKLQQTMYAIQNNHASSRRLQYMGRLQTFVESMDQYGKVLEVFTNATDLVAFVWGPIKLILQIASNFSEAFNSLLDAYQEIGENMPQVLKYQQLLHDRPHMKRVLSLMYTDLLEFHREVLKCLKGRMWKQLFQATWRGLTSKIKGMIEKMRRHNHLLEGHATLAEIEETISFRTKMEAEIQEAKEREQQRRRSFVIKWLSATSAQAIQEMCEKARSVCPNSGTWLLSDTRFVKWFHPKYCTTPLLWLNGIPGAGKTVLASLVVEEAQKLPDNTVAFFYCRYEVAQQNTFLAVAKGVISQLLAQNDSEDLLLFMFDKATRSGETSLSSPKLAKELLRIVLGKCGTTYIIIDGLDECSREDRKDISLFFRHAVESVEKAEAGRIHCLFVSQDDGAARKDYKTLAKLKLTPEDNKKDIKAFAEVWQDKIKEKFPDLDLKGQNVAERVTSGSGGMFLFAMLVTRNLYEQPTLRDLMNELQPGTFPKGIEQAYGRILKRIDETLSPAQLKVSKRLLGWIMCAKRSLKWREIQGAISIVPENETVDPARRLRDDPKDLCGSLVEKMADDSLELVHSTAKKYLAKEEYVKPAEVEHDLTLLCLAYLNFHFLTLSVFDDSDNEEMIREALLDGFYSFLDYAVVYWVSHFEDDIAKPEELGRIDILNGHLEKFLEKHFLTPKSKPAVSPKVQSKLAPFESDDFYDHLAQAFAFATKQKGVFGKAPSDDDILDLHRVVAGVRVILEQLASLPDQDGHTAVLAEFYGPHLFKCPRINCQFFDKGFKTQAERDEHIARHERAFICSYEGCHQADIGYSTLKELEKHLSAVHHLDSGGDLEFPETPKPQKKQEGNIPCPQCGEKFTRKYNMVSHLQKHSGTKNIKCKECDKAFYKSSDYQRHMRIHWGIKTYTCGGPLKNGEAWGCGKGFARADKLKQHHQSETGRRCKQPWYDELAREEEERKARDRERVLAEAAAKELERIKAEQEAAMERARQEESEDARERARRYAEAMGREWERMQEAEEARKKAQREAEELRRSQTPVYIPAMVDPPSPPEGSTPLPPFSSLTKSLSDNESDC